MNHEERRRLMEFQRDQEDRFVHDAVTAGGGVASRGGPKGGHRPLALPLAGGGAAGVSTGGTGIVARTWANCCMSRFFSATFSPGSSCSGGPA